MTLRTSLDTFRWSLSLALGIAPLVGCGGATSIDGGGTGGHGGSGGGGSARFPCENPEPIVGGSGEPTGFVQCKGGAIHRTAKQECPFPSRSAACPVPANCDPAAGGCIVQCQLDSDCTDSPHGRCVGESVGGGLPGCYCSYRCLNDGECGPGQICQCDALGGTCVDAKCTTDSECSDGNLCTSVVASPGCGGVRFACQTSLDECLSDADCPSGRQCALNDTPGVPGSGTAHVCMAPTCAIGRPFLVNGAPRLAPCVERDDFRSALLPAVETLDESARETLRLRWTEIALMEHASVAAFARFLQDLFSFGAPAELVERTVAAMGDETRHAKDAFALASAYAGKGLGPGVLDAADDRPRSRREVVVTTILEGCIGETVAAVEAAEALARAADPAVRTALARVAQEESRHAELAWKFVSWVLSSGDSELAAETRSALLDVARGALRDAGKARGPVSANADGEVLAAHGILDDALRAEIRARALSELFVPCAMALVRVHDERLPRAA